MKIKKELSVNVLKAQAVQELDKLGIEYDLDKMIESITVSLSSDKMGSTSNKEVEDVKSLLAILGLLDIVHPINPEHVENMLRDSTYKNMAWDIMHRLWVFFDEESYDEFYADMIDTLKEGISEDVDWRIYDYIHDDSEMSLKLHDEFGVVVVYDL